MMDESSTSKDRFNLQRFVEAQAPVFEQVLSELRKGSKQTHWIWFIFPQLAGLGHSHMTKLYSLSSLAEAEAYIAHPLLGPRLRECTILVNLVSGRSIEEIFGYPDDLKFRSSMTLFSHATSDKAVFVEALNKYFHGQPDSLTLERLK